MQTPYLKFLQTKKGLRAVFQQENGRLLCRIFQGQTTGVPILIAENTLPYFSLCSYREYTYLLYTSTQGEVILSASKDLCRWEPRTLFRQERPGPTCYFMAPQQDALHLIYHQPMGNTGLHSLMYTVFQQGQCQKPYCIDHFLPSPPEIFRAKRLGENHLILYYRSAKTTLSARELLLSPFTVGSLSPLIQTASPWLDVSVHDHGEKIHVLYLARNLFRTQVLYRYRQTASISRPRLIWEGVGCSSCLLTQEQERVCLLWTAGGETFRCLSADNGHTFGPVESMTEEFPYPLEKGQLVTEDASFFAEEALGNKEWYYLPKNISTASADRIAAAESGPSAAELAHLLAQQKEELSQWKQKAAQLESRLSALHQENLHLRERTTPPEEPSEPTAEEPTVET